MSHWDRFQKSFVRYPGLGFSIDISRMGFEDSLFTKMAGKIEHAFKSMKELEAGAIANPDENRMVGHYWLRDSKLAPDAALKKEIDDTLEATLKFAADVHAGSIKAANGQKFTRVLVVGICGSALGPQLVAHAITPANPPLAISFLDNTDPDGMDRTLDAIGAGLGETLTVIISKSGGTKETRNGTLEAKAAYERAGLTFGKHAVAGRNIQNFTRCQQGQGRARQRFPGTTRRIMPFHIAGNRVGPILVIGARAQHQR